MSHPQILESLRTCLAVSKTDIRRPIVGCILQLTRTNPKRRREIVDAGFVSTLRHLCDWSGAAGSPGGRSPAVVEDDRDVIDQARLALDWLEHGDAYMLASNSGSR